MTNELSVEASSTLPGFVIHEPIPLESELLFALWLVTVVMIIIGIIWSVYRKGNERSTQSVARWTLVMSTILLFLGSGIVAWTTATRIAELLDISFTSSFSSSFELHMLMVMAATQLRLLAVNVILAGVGFVLALIMFTTTRRTPTGASSPTA